MREIKFRGKSDNDWVYGFLMKVDDFDQPEHDKFDYFIQTDRVAYEEYEKFYITDNNTIGQYTGLKDKNGIEIYEGDIILTQPYRDKPFSSKAKEKRLKGIVFYNIKCGKNFVHDSDTLKYWGAEWNIEIIDKEAYKKYSCCSWGSFFECEVIGNIYDNPELLKEAKI